MRRLLPASCSRVLSSVHPSVHSSERTNRFSCLISCSPADAASRDPALATAAAARLGEEWNLPPQSEAALRTHIASALEPLSTFPTDGLRSEQLIDIEART